MATGVVLPVLLATTAAVLTPGSASSAPSEASPAAAYGELVNRTNKQMEFASFSGNGRVHRCDVWNNTVDARRANFENLKCKQQPLDPGQDAGGPGDGGDVDGFTFERNAYSLHMMLPLPTIPPVIVSKGTKKKGVWTKITNVDDASCSGTGSKPACLVTIG
ncbi:hypothetical protein [Streptomyces alboflavus]|uniref:hypothetical protein n=1 Tax=Streptomyces alboflavus TaxID=67267 RepID=UPI0004C1F828|nr:hypothetical protein [Streptomyces alboflavus]